MRARPQMGYQIKIIVGALTQQKPRCHGYDVRESRSTGGFMWVQKRARLVSQSLSALCTSSLENVSAVSGLHSLTEAMLLFSLTLLRLVGSEHFCFLLVRWSEANKPHAYRFYTMTTYIIYKTNRFVKNFMKFLAFFLIFEENNVISLVKSPPFRSVFQKAVRIWPNPTRCIHW